MASKEPLLIDLDQARSATALPLDQQLFREQFDQVIALVNDFAARGTARRTDRAGGGGGSPDDVLHEAILIAGARGSGKTTFILSLGEVLSKQSGGRIAALRPLDPTMVDGDTVFIAAVIANVLRHVEEFLRRDRGPKSEALQRSLERLSDGLLASSNAAWERSLLQAGSSSAFAERLVTFARGGLRLREVFAEFLGAAADLCGATIFVQPIDDVDTAGPQAHTVLETVRRYLTNARVLPIITGDLIQFRQVLLAARLQEVEVLWKHDPVKGSHGADAVRGAEALADQYLLKLVRPERRFQLRSAREALSEREVTVDSPGGKFDLEVLLRGAVDWTDPRPKYATPQALLPENTRLLRALLLWATARADRPIQPWEPKDFVDLLLLDDQAQRLSRWSASGLQELTAGRFAPFRDWVLADGSPRSRLALEPPKLPVGDEWSEALVCRSAAGVLRARFLKDSLLPLSYFFEVAWPADLAGAGVVDPGKVKRLVEPGAARHTAARILAERWDSSTASPSVQPGMARLPNATARTKGTDSLRHRWWHMRHTPARLGPLPWLRWLWGDGPDTDRRDYVWQLLVQARRNSGREVERADTTWLFEPEIERLLLSEKRPTQRALFRFVMAWFRGRVGVATGGSQVLDLGIGLAAVLDLATRYRALSVDDRTDDEVRLMLDRGLYRPDDGVLAARTAASAGSPTADDDEDLIEGADGDVEASELPDAFVASVKAWLDAAVNTPPVANPVRPAVMARWATLWRETQEAQADPKRAQAWCVGSFLSRGVLGMLNALLIAEASGSGRPMRDERSMVSSLKLDGVPGEGGLPGNYSAFGKLAVNLGRVRGGATVASGDLPLFDLIARCPILTLVLLPEWRELLSPAQAVVTREYARVGLGEDERGSMDLAVLLHALPLMQAAPRVDAVPNDSASRDWAERVGLQSAPDFDRGAPRDVVSSDAQWAILDSLAEGDPLLDSFANTQARKTFVSQVRQKKNFRNPMFFKTPARREHYAALFEHVLLPRWKVSQVDAPSPTSST